MSARTVGAAAETAPGERRVALSPDGAARLLAADHQVIIEAGAGDAAWFTDSDYTDAGARLLTRREVYEQADIIVCVHPPAAADVSLLRPGQVLDRAAGPPPRSDLARSLAEAKVTAISLDGLPRTLSARPVDGRAHFAGQRRRLQGGAGRGRHLRRLLPDAHDRGRHDSPGAGAGARRRRRRAAGDRHRPPARRGGHRLRRPRRRPAPTWPRPAPRFLDLASAVSAAGDGGYARALTDDERAAQQAALAERIAGSTSSSRPRRYPGGRPPVLVSASARCKRCDPARWWSTWPRASSGGNVDGSRAGRRPSSPTTASPSSAPATCPSGVPKAASTAYARNITALLAHLVRDGALVLDPDDAITAGVLITHDGEVVHPAVRALIEAPAPEVRCVTRPAVRRHHRSSC